MQDRSDMKGIISYTVDAIGAYDVRQHGGRPDRDGRVVASLWHGDGEWGRFLAIPILYVQEAPWGAPEAIWDASLLWRRGVSASQPIVLSDRSGATYRYWPMPAVDYVVEGERRLGCHHTISDLLDLRDECFRDGARARRWWQLRGGGDPIAEELAETRIAWRHWSQEAAPLEAAKASLRGNELLMTPGCLSSARTERMQQTMSCIQQLFAELIGDTIHPLTWSLGTPSETRKGLAKGQLPVRPMADINWLIKDLLDQICDAEAVFSAHAWAIEHGSKDLKAFALSGRFDERQDAYFAERLEVEMPGWQFFPKVSLRTPTAPSMEAVDLLISLRAIGDSVELVLAGGREALRREFMGRNAYLLVGSQY